MNRKIIFLLSTIFFLNNIRAQQFDLNNIKIDDVKNLLGNVLVATFVKVQTPRLRNSSNGLNSLVGLLICGTVQLASRSWIRPTRLVFTKGFISVLLVISPFDQDPRSQTKRQLSTLKKTTNIFCFGDLFSWSMT